MTEVGEQVQIFGHGSCVVLQIYTSEKGLTGKDKWEVLFYIQKNGRRNSIPSKAVRDFRPPMWKSLDELGETAEEARFRVWAMEQLGDWYRGDRTAAWADALARLAELDPESAEKFQPAPAVTFTPDPAEQLAKLAELHKAGILTDEEFAIKKADLLKRI